MNKLKVLIATTSEPTDPAVVKAASERADEEFDKRGIQRGEVRYVRSDPAQTFFEEHVDLGPVMVHTFLAQEVTS